MDIFLVASLVVLLVISLYDAVMAIRNFMYQKRWDDEKAQILFDNPAITAAELCAKYVDFCAQNHCLVEY